MIQTGFVAIKTAHARLQGCAPLRLLSIIADPRWTALLPILAWVIEHPRTLAFTRRMPTIFLPTHDPQALTRLRTGL